MKVIWGKHKGKYCYAATSKVAVFRLLKQNGKVHIVTASNTEIETLLPIIREQVKPDSIFYKVPPSMLIKAMTVRKTGNIWKSIDCRTALCTKPIVNIRYSKRKLNATDICRRPVMWSNKASVRCTVSSAMPGQPISGWLKWVRKAIWRRCVWTCWKLPTG